MKSLVWAAFGFESRGKSLRPCRERVFRLKHRKLKKATTLTKVIYGRHVLSILSGVGDEECQQRAKSRRKIQRDGADATF